jgi:predicted secreted hydrolase
MNKPARRGVLQYAPTIWIFLLLFFVAPASSERPVAALSFRPFEPAQPGYRFSFPRDHGAHPDFKIEWWYFTGNLTTDGKDYGYELTFFRHGVDQPQTEKNPSRWAIRDLYFAHFALTDGEGKRFYHTDKISREAIGKAGAQTDRLEVWVDRWRAIQKPDGTIHLLAEAEGEVEEGSWKINLLLNPDKPLVVHGTGGISRKGGEPGQASHYLSFTRLQTKGTLSINGKEKSVSGLSWMDHEFSSSMLNENQVGWDWFSIQMEDGREVMLYQIRTVDGGKDPFSSGTMIEPDGTARPLPAEAFTLTPLRNWKSKKSGGDYPVAWRIEIPSERLILVSEPLLDNQELITSKSTRVAYWEGASRFRGTNDGKSIEGKGYIEMTGYAEPFNK